MESFRILLIDHDPFPNVLRRAAASVGVGLEVHISKTYRDAADWLHLADEIDAVFICYRFRNGDDTIESGLVEDYTYCGFGGINGKPLVAFSRDFDEDKKLLAAGCNKRCDPGLINDFFLSEFGQEVQP